MPINVPDNPKIYTTKYDNFKGVDFTNDATNVWRRRSPTGVNMLPDESGRPFKRHGWNILISNAELCTELEVSECAIQKCSYFELAGVDHLVIFTSQGVLFYANEVFTAKSTDPDCYTGYDRSFFFEGDGMSAFYIYSNYRVWRYSYKNETDSFVFEEVTDEITVPTVLITANANCAGVVHESYNLIGTKARVEYNDINLFEYWCSGEMRGENEEGHFIIKVDETAFCSGKTRGNPSRYVYAYEEVNDELTWNPSLPASIECIGSPKKNDLIIVVYAYGVILPNNVTSDQIADVKAWATKKEQFKWKIPVVIEGSAGDAILHPDPTGGRRAWVEFKYDTVASEIKTVVDGEDFLRVEFPSKTVTVTPYDDLPIQSTVDLIGA